MRNPQQYIDLLQEFNATDRRAVRIDETSRDDELCLRMAAYCLGLPIDVRTIRGQQKGVFLIRKVLAE